MENPLPRYALVTPARNEAAYIALTLESVTRQTIPPVRWIIVNDGSTDDTEAIVQEYAKRFPWITLIQMPSRSKRDFAGKAHAFHAGYIALANTEFEVIGNLDADVSFGADHFEYLMARFAENSRLGVAGTAFLENSAVAYDYDFVDSAHVSGQCQMFRRTCFDSIGGYVPIKGGGIDWTAVTTARMRGWHTQTFTDRVFTHHRLMGTGMSGAIASKYRFGKQDFYLGSHPLWEFFRCVYQAGRRPYLVGGMLLYAGYIVAYLSGTEKAIPKELVEFRRKEQMARLKRKFYSTLGMSKE